MNPQQSIFMYLKLGIVGLMLVGIFVLAALGKIDAQVAITSAVGAVGALVVALGISSAGGAAATAIQAQTRAMVARGEAVDAVDQVKRVGGVLAKGDQRGFVSVRALVGLLVLGSGITIAILGIGDLMGCSGSVSVPPGVATAGANFAACVLVTATTDEIAGMQPGAIAVDCLAKCGGDLTSIATVLDARAKSKAMLAAATDGGK